MVVKETAGRGRGGAAGASDGPDPNPGASQACWVWGGNSAAWPAATQTLCLALGWPGLEKALYGPMHPALRELSRRQSLCCPHSISLPSFLFQPCFLTRPRPGIRFY